MLQQLVADAKAMEAEVPGRFFQFVVWGMVGQPNPGLSLDSNFFQSRLSIILLC